VEVVRMKLPAEGAVAPVKLLNVDSQLARQAEKCEVVGQLMAYAGGCAA